MSVEEVPEEQSLSDDGDNIIEMDGAECARAEEGCARDYAALLVEQHMEDKYYEF